MKNHVEIGHLTKYDAFRVDTDQPMNLEKWFESIQTSLILGQRPPKSYKLLSFLWYFQYMTGFYSRHKSERKFGEYVWFGGTLS